MSGLVARCDFCKPVRRPEFQIERSSPGDVANKDERGCPLAISLRDVSASSRIDDRLESRRKVYARRAIPHRAADANFAQNISRA